MDENVWSVRLSKKTNKSIGQLPTLAIKALTLLMRDIELFGPVCGNWPNYSKLGPKKHHCHLKKGKPTYVAVWIETGKSCEVEVIYAGTHEKAPY